MGGVRGDVLRSLHGNTPLAAITDIARIAEIQIRTQTFAYDTILHPDLTPDVLTFVLPLGTVI